MTLQRLRESLALILLAVLPFHALFVTVSTKLLEGPGHAPLGWLAIWKEALLVLIVLLALFELMEKRFRHRWWLEFDMIDACIVGAAMIAAALGIYNENLLSTQVVYGIRYDFVLPLSFLVLRRVHWSERFLKKLPTIFLVSGAILVVWGIVSLLLPFGALQALGYSDLHSLYVKSGPLAPFQMIGETGIRRMQSAMSGPNQLGLWLLIPLAYALTRKKLLISSLFLLGIFLTFSRASWIAAAVITVLSLWMVVPKRKRLQIFGSLVLAGVLVIVGIFAVKPEIISRATSNRNHLERPLHALQMIIRHPYGLGLGTAGPATNRTHETCVELPEGADTSWAKGHPDLCVFTGKSQVQPLDHACSCPVLPENWYLQIGVEIGVLGMLLYLIATVLLLKELFKEERKEIFLAFLGVCIAGLFLHSFEDFGVAATLWVLIAICRPPQR